MPPALIAAVIGGTAAVGSALINKSATDKATGAATDAANANNALQKQIYDKNTANLQPYITTGTGALGRLDASQQAGFDWNKFLANDPAAQFQMQQGTNAITSQAAATGGLGGGGTLKALNRFGQGLGSSQINDWWNRNSQLAQFGLSGANALAGVGTSYAGAVGQNNNNAAGAIGNGALTNANTFGNLLGQGAQIAGNYFQPQQLSPLPLQTNTNYGGNLNTIPVETSANFQPGAGSLPFYGF